VLRCQDVRRLEIAVHDVAGVEVVQPFEDLDDVGGDEPLVEFAEGFECLSEGSVLNIPKAIRC